MDATTHARICALIKSEEGLRLKAYRCTSGKWTIGYGHNLEAHGVSAEEAATTVWTKEQAESALLADVDRVISGLSEWMRELSGPRLAVLVSMAFQMGVPGLFKFSRTLNAIRSGQFDKASGYMLDSLWARQTPARARRHAETIRTGKWPAEALGA